MSIVADVPGANDARSEPMSILPSMPSDGTQVLPSASMHSPLVQAVANELQSSLVMHCAQACLPMRFWICVATCDCRVETMMPLATALVKTHRIPPESVTSPSGMVMLVVPAESAVVLVVLSTVNVRSLVAFIGPALESMVTSQAPMSDASMGSGMTVETLMLVSTCKTFGMVGVSVSVCTSSLSWQ